MAEVEEEDIIKEEKIMVTGTLMIINIKSSKNKIHKKIEIMLEEEVIIQRDLVIEDPVEVVTLEETIEEMTDLIISKDLIKIRMMKGGLTLTIDLMKLMKKKLKVKLKKGSLKSRDHMEEVKLKI